MNIIGGSEIEKKEAMESQECKILVMINVVFSLIEPEHPFFRKKDRDTALAYVIQPYEEYNPGYDIGEKPDKYFYEQFFYSCKDLTFDSDGICDDEVGVFERIYKAYVDVLSYIKRLDFPKGSEVKICVDITGMKPISDVAWGFALKIDGEEIDRVENDTVSNLLRLTKTSIAEDLFPFGCLVLVSRVMIWNLDFLYRMSFKAHSINHEGREPRQLDKSDLTKNTASIKEQTMSIPHDSKIDESSPSGHDKKDEDNNETNNKNDTNTNNTMDSIHEGFVSNSILKLIRRNTDFLFWNPSMIAYRLNGTDKKAYECNAELYYALHAWYKGEKEDAVAHLRRMGFLGLEVYHGMLDIASVIISPLSLFDALIYGIQADYVYFRDGYISEEVEISQTEAAITAVGAIPFVKIFKGLKQVPNLIKKGEEVKKIQKAIEKESSTIAKLPKRNSKELIEEAEKHEAKAITLKNQAAKTPNKGHSKKQKNKNEKIRAGLNAQADKAIKHANEIRKTVKECSRREIKERAKCRLQDRCSVIKKCINQTIEELKTDFSFKDYKILNQPLADSIIQKAVYDMLTRPEKK